MSKLWIIGDSFAGGSSDKKSYWIDILCKNFNGGKYYVSSKGSRDFQTILDIFLRNLKNIEKDDFVILIIPTLIRTRLPLKTPRMDVEISNFINPKKTFDYFIGAHSYIKEVEECKLENPLTEIDELEVVENSNIWSIINASDASKNNYVEILNSLKEYLPFNIFIWSWENEIESDLVMIKDEITKELGFWETQNDVWMNTNGTDGICGDAHWSEKTHKAFADYMITKFPQFFNV